MSSFVAVLFVFKKLLPSDLYWSWLAMPALTFRAVIVLTGLGAAGGHSSSCVAFAAGGSSASATPLPRPTS